MIMTRLRITAVCLAFLWAASALAGNLDPTGAPTDGSSMPTLQGIYDQLNSGATSTTTGTFQEPLAGPIAGTGKTLADIQAKLPVPDNNNGATVNDVLSGRTFWGVRTDGTWGPNTGTIFSQGNVTGSSGALVITIPDGYYSGGKTATAGDANLASGNIRAGTTVFGVAGDPNVVNTGGATAAPLDMADGKTAYVNGQLVTGSLPPQLAIDGLNGQTLITLPDGIYKSINVMGGMTWQPTARCLDTNLASGNIRSGVSIFGVNGTFSSGATASAADILAGKTACVNGQPVTGTVTAGSDVNGSNGILQITIPDGLYSGGKTATAVDSNLNAGSVRCGVTIFGVSGKCGVVPATGQTTSYAPGDDGSYQYGIKPAVAPSAGTSGAYNTPSWVGTATSRFTDNGNGTVTDNFTGLIWLKNANCTDPSGGVSRTTLYGDIQWTNALTWSNNLASGSCGLSDGSTAGQWRLPNINELHSLGPNFPPGAPFTNVQSEMYWSSSTYAFYADYTWNMDMRIGSVNYYFYKSGYYYVWPVRGGQ